jgi:hypothetical protein
MCIEKRSILYWFQALWDSLKKLLAIAKANLYANFKLSALKAFSRFFVYNFPWGSFFYTLFNLFKISIKFSDFVTHIVLLRRKKIWVILALFEIFLCKWLRNGTISKFLLKRKTHFFAMSINLRMILFWIPKLPEWQTSLFA